MALSDFPAAPARAGINVTWLAADIGRPIGTVRGWVLGRSAPPPEIVAWLHRRPADPPPQVTARKPVPPQLRKAGSSTDGAAGS